MVAPLQTGGARCPLTQDGGRRLQRCRSLRACLSAARPTETVDAPPKGAGDLRQEVIGTRPGNEKGPPKRAFEKLCAYPMVNITGDSREGISQPGRLFSARSVSPGLRAKEFLHPSYLYCDEIRVNPVPGASRHGMPAVRTIQPCVSANFPSVQEDPSKRARAGKLCGQTDLSTLSG